MTDYSGQPEKCSRPLFACLFAAKKAGTPEAADYLNKLADRLEQELEEAPYELFVELGPIPVGYSNSEATRAKLRSAVCRQDMLKMIPGMMIRD